MMKYIKNLILAYKIYDELKNVQIGTTFRRITQILNGFNNIDLANIKPEDLMYLFRDLKNPRDIVYGNLEMLRAMRILERIKETSAIYKITALGKYLMKQDTYSLGFEILNILNHLDSIKILLQFIKDNLEVESREISNSLGNEMSFYNELIFGKDWKKPFNEPISQTLLSLLTEVKILEKNNETKKFFIREL